MFFALSQILSTNSLKHTRQRAISKVVLVQCHVENMCVIIYFYNFIVPTNSWCIEMDVKRVPALIALTSEAGIGTIKKG